MTNELEQQMVNEIRHLLEQINQKYTGFFHCKLFTIIDMEKESCAECIKAHQKCVRCVIGVREPSAIEQFEKSICDQAPELKE